MLRNPKFGSWGGVGGRFVSCWSAHQQSGNKEGKRFSHAIFSEEDRHSTDIKCASANCQSFGLHCEHCPDVVTVDSVTAAVCESENGRLSKTLNTMLTFLASAAIFWLLHPMTHGAPLGLSRMRATHIRKSIQSFDFVHIIKLWRPLPSIGTYFLSGNAADS